jgi:ATP synthase protein I
MNVSKRESLKEAEARETTRKSSIAYAAGFSLFASVVTLCGLGWALDRWLGTSPWLLVSGLVLGAVVGFYQFVRLTSKLS